MSGDYVNINDVKDSLDITHDNDDEELKEIAEDVNQEIDTCLKSVADSLPLDLTSDEGKYAKKTGKILALSMWKAKIKQFDDAKYYESKFEKKIKKLIVAIKADLTTRSKIVIRSPDYDTEEDILSSQRLIR